MRIPSHLGTLNHGPWSCSGLWFNFKLVLKSPATKVCSSEVVDCEFRQVVISINPEVVSEFTQPQDSRKKRMAKHLCMTRVTFIVCYVLPSFTKRSVLREVKVWQKVVSHIIILSRLSHKVCRLLSSPFLLHTGADLGGGRRGCAPPSPPSVEMTCGFLIQLVFC